MNNLETKNFVIKTKNANNNSIKEAIYELTDKINKHIETIVKKAKKEHKSYLLMGEKIFILSEDLSTITCRYDYITTKNKPTKRQLNYFSTKKEICKIDKK